MTRPIQKCKYNKNNKSNQQSNREQISKTKKGILTLKKHM